MKAEELEGRRLRLQAELDAAKDQAERNRLGQFATPTGLARDMLRYARTHLGESTRVRFLDPAIGSGSFYAALLRVFAQSKIAGAVGYEIDPHYGTPASALWGRTGLDVRSGDFTRAAPPAEREKFNLLICNPPYVRHHHIGGGEKQRLKVRAREAGGVEINGLSGLYCYFLTLCHAWMADGGLAGWLIPSEFMDVNYGASVKRYLLDKVTLLRIHRFNPNEVQFGDALVSSAVVWFRKEKPPRDYEARFTYGGSLQQPELDRAMPAAALRRTAKWTRYPAKAGHETADAPLLGDLFTIKRGLVTGSNDFFILPAEEIERRGLPMEWFRPILPSPRYLPVNEAPADDKGNPVLERRLFLLDCRLKEDEIERRHPRLWAYLEEGKARGVAERYLCRHRTPWYAPENRAPAPFLCTYLGRGDKKSGKPFRFILNDSQATAANVYLMLYPKPPLARVLQGNPHLKRQVWALLNAISPAAMLGEGRVYGGGLHKLEPRELGNVPAAAIAELLPGARPRRAEQGELFAA